MTSPKAPVQESEVKRRDPEATKSDILAVATDEFANRGFTGARVDRIAEDTATTKRMIYYYFGSKEGLYIAALEAAYVNFRMLEMALNVDEMDPVAALRTIAVFTFDHHMKHHDFIRLVQTENVNKVAYLKKSPRVKELKGAVITTLQSIMKRGQDAGIFRTDLEPLDVHMAISALTVFPVANQHTIKLIFGHDLLDKKYQPKYREMVGDLIVDTVTRVS
jgi:AcrR family transcriptional regulator